MAVRKSAMKMPEFLVFIKMFVIGFLGAEIFRIAFYLGTAYVSTLNEVPIFVKVFGIAGFALCLIYAAKRDAYMLFTRIGRSYRIDLLAAASIGIWSNDLASPWLAKVHAVAKSADPYWAVIIFTLLSIILLSPLIQLFISRHKKNESQLHFLEDEEICDGNEDLLKNSEQAKSFAETVLASGAHPGLVFGVDGPWGVGKTSFINLAEHYWKLAADKVIVCRFEPLRYASEPDLADRLIRDLSAAIQSKIFAPEFRPAVSRYSRLIKGKADFSFLGFKLSLEPSQDTADELLDDIDDVLRRIDRRVIIVIDDLDRLDAKTINNVLFATKRTFKLSQATYVLCYDTEVLAGNDEGSRAREFLEKFVTVKLSLFVDSSSLCEFLRHDWVRDGDQFGSVPSDTMIKLGAVLNELADILNDDLAANYLPLVGNLRKVKRFINTILLMQIEKTDLGRTDFNKRDLINLMLLHLHYPGVFRRIYAEETEGRSGTFSLRREYGEEEFKNAETFALLEKEVPSAAYFLLKQLFDAETLNIGNERSAEESILRSRACFNSDKARNLEAYLKLIVRFASPEPQETFVLYQSAVEQVQNGASIVSVLTSPDFNLTQGEHSHDQFWRVLVNHSYDFNKVIAQDAIDTLIEYLPRYSMIDNDDRSLRTRSIYSLLRLLDRAGWGRTSGQRRANNADNVLEITWRIFGEKNYNGASLLERLASPDRGVLGWNDLMLFRLQCSEDRRGQLHNLHKALLVHQDMNAPTSGLVNQLALQGMRILSQKVFSLFKETFIETQRNFLTEVNDTSVKEFLGIAFSESIDDASKDPQTEDGGNTIAQSVAAARSVVMSFVIYQLSNSHTEGGSGIGCGHYDEEGKEDGGNIAKLMNQYVFDLCFNPEIQADNVLLFLDHCLAHLSSPFYTGREDGYIATKEGILGGLDMKEMGRYWHRHREHIRGLNLHTIDRKVFTSSYTAFYREDLDGVLAVLDELANEFIQN
jgi:hypothetical protein